MAVRIDKEICSGCHDCYEVCPTDIFSAEEPGEPPQVIFPEDCWYCGSCIEECPVDAIKMFLPLTCL